MMKTKLQNKHVVWLLILPLVILATGLLHIQYTGLFFLRSVDPEYAYLFNGLILAHFHPDIQYTGHPGIPVQCMVAMVARTAHLFRPGQPLVNDVLQNPEFYIRAVLYTSTVLQVVTLFLLGYYMHRYSGNMIAAVFLQLTPFTHIITLEVAGRLMPELVMGSIVCCWLILLVKMIYEDHELRNYKRYSLLFAVLFGISLADKLTFLPFFLLPLIVLPSWKFRLRFILFSLFFFMLFAFPVILNHKVFFRWIFNIFTHTGAYGGGGRGIVDWSEFADHVKVLPGNTPILLITLLSLVILTVLYLWKQRMQKQVLDIHARISLALIAVIVVQYLMAAKHFAFHYMTPSLLITVIGLFISTMLFDRLLHSRANKRITTWIPVIFGLLLLFNIAPKEARHLKHIREVTTIRTEAYNRLFPMLNMPPKIICPSYYGCSATEYALTFGLHESGRHGDFLFKEMQKLYPETYLYLPWGRVFYEGNRETEPAMFLQPYTVYTLYIADYSDEQLAEITGALNTNGKNLYCVTKEIYHSEATGEAIFLLQTQQVTHE